MNRIKSLQVFYHNQKVGTLACTKDDRIAFEYDEQWLLSGFSISPFSLPLKQEVFVPRNYDPFEGLFGVFADSLPDGWGRLLVDRLLRKKNIEPYQVNSLQRLSIVAQSGMGALRYFPKNHIVEDTSHLTLEELALECVKMFETEKSDNLDELFHMGGSSGGARPKIYYEIDGAEWIVKFPSSMDSFNIGEQEYNYSLCAKRCGIEMPETRLLSSQQSSGYFAVKRFDRRKGERIHMVSVSGLLETSHRIPNLDYHTLMRLTMLLTDDYNEIEKMFRLMCFNVFAHNRDDHSKNFSFLYQNDHWQLSPAYDLTYSSSLGGEHATTVDGNGQNPGKKELLAVAKKIKFDMKKAQKIVEEIQTYVMEDLRDYLNS